ncbi:hypothetical protein [Paraburkholderia sp. BL17N1]|uniref:hypothetical protein n=1 Tax=Paraburkholderia sp. BL17N1 TaxID=1938798 RepID=UPI000F2B4524|nr:hypothetical protein [Paraburkholderia sp. BL17N1]RKR38628.1 hypothetical protein B0G82_6781 [Paraburkholderia sp. BL17N1]
MAWNTGYSVISYVRSSLWVVPILALMAGIALKRIADTSASGWRRMMHMNCNAGFLPSILAKRIPGPGGESPWLINPKR